MTDHAAEADENEGARMRDVAHTPPHGEGANGVWSRGDVDAESGEETSSGDVDAPPVRGPTDDE